MERSHADERTPIILRHEVPSPVRDTRESYQKQLAIYLILASTLIERIAFYTIVATLSVVVDPDECSGKGGPIVTLIFTGASYFCTLFFAIISDRWLGRAKTVLLGYIFYLSGYILLATFTSGSIEQCDKKTAVQLFTENCSYYTYPALIMTAIGAGAVQCNTSVLGGEQYQDIPDISRYFDRYVIALNIGAIIAKFSFFFADPTNKDYYYAYICGVSALVVSFILFLIGFRYYLQMKSAETLVIQCIPVTINAIQNWYRHRRDHHENTRVEGSTDSDGQQEHSFLDFAKVENQGKFIGRTVEEVKSLRDTVIVFILLIPYWLVYDQLNSTFRLQAKHMHGTTSWSMIGVSLVDPIVIIVGILILNTCIYRLINADKRLLSIPMKFIIGMCFATATMLVAGSIEIARQKNWEPGVNFSNLTISAQIPQVFLMGTSELFVMVASFEYAYFSAPRSAQAFFMSLRFCALGISSFLGATYISLYEIHAEKLDFSCHEEREHDWRFSGYFFILGVIQFLFLLIFIGCQKRYKLIKLNRQKINVSSSFTR